MLGLRPYGEAAKIATEGLVDAATAFLSRLCLPAAEELGLLARDRVSHWRSLHAANIAEKTRRKVEILPNAENLKAHPRLVGELLIRGRGSRVTMFRSSGLGC